MNPLYNVNVKAILPLITPEELKKKYPATASIEKSVIDARQTIKNIISGTDKRLLVVVGPCSIHDTDAAWDYAQRLDKLRKKVKKSMVIVMRVYFEKPRTTIGWKGLINDPNLDNSCNMNAGLALTRKLLIKIAKLGLPMATEVLDTVSPQYIADLISWAAIGARTTESQTHREMVSGLSMATGFKNATSGNLQVAIDAIKSAKNPHSFIGINQEGRTSIIRTMGNKSCHIVLRGGDGKPNYDEKNVDACGEKLKEADLSPTLMVDCSHANSDKDYRKQKNVLKHVINQRKKGNENIVGVMIESNINAGNQSIPKDLSKLAYGVSITDSCLDWESTEELLLWSHKTLNI